MSRRKGEFEHRTSIFEGAYRAWSHLGGCEAEKLFSDNAAEELDPLRHPHVNDPRLPECKQQQQQQLQKQQQRQSGTAIFHDSGGDCCTNEEEEEDEDSPLSNNPPAPPTRTSTIEYVYEPLPRQGLSHPFVQSIIAPWLGPQAKEDDIKKGLTILRTWWQHRRAGESISAVKALGTEKMKKIVAGYTRHFFKLALYMVIRDHEIPPKSLKLDDILTTKSKSSKDSTNNGIGSNKRKERDDEINHNTKISKVVAGGCCGSASGTTTIIDVDQVSASAASLQQNIFGNPSRTPVVFVSANGDIQIAISIEGMTCGNCVKIVETGLRGVTGSPPPIEGLLDAVADFHMSAAIIKISKASYAKRIAREANELLSMLGYSSMAREMDVVDSYGVKTDFASLTAAFDIVAATNTSDLFDWSLQCTCPENGGILANCERHSQMNKRIFDAFDNREKELMSFVAGCGKKHGLPCTCTPGTCKCKSGTCCKQKEHLQQQAADLQMKIASNPPTIMIMNSINNIQPVLPAGTNVNMSIPNNMTAAIGVPIMYHQQMQQQQALNLVGGPDVMQQITLLPRTQPMLPAHQILAQPNAGNNLSTTSNHLFIHPRT